MSNKYDDTSHLTANQRKIVEQEVRRRYNRKHGDDAWDAASDDERAEYYNKSYESVCKKMNIN